MRKRFAVPNLDYHGLDLWMLNQISKYKEGQINAGMELYIYIEYNQ